MGRQVNIGLDLSDAYNDEDQELTPFNVTVSETNTTATVTLTWEEMSDLAEDCNQALLAYDRRRGNE